jgi:hypothetical protein
MRRDEALPPPEKSSVPARSPDLAEKNDCRVWGPNSHEFTFLISRASTRWVWFFTIILPLDLRIIIGRL